MMRRIAAVVLAALVVVVAGCKGTKVVPFVVPVAAPIDQVVGIRANGVWRCACVRVADGCYSAKHCFQALPRGAVVTVGGLRLGAYSLDPNRDLAHIAMWAQPGVEIGSVPSEGGVAYWIGQRSGIATKTFEWVMNSALDFPPRSPSVRAMHIDAQTFDIWCYAKGGVDGTQEVANGDSGGGVYFDGRPVGIISLSDPEGCWLATVRIP